MHRKKMTAAAWVMAAALAVTTLPVNAFAAEPASQVTEVSGSEALQAQTLAADDDTAETNTVTIDSTTEDPVGTIQNAINNATEDTTIQLNADPAEGTSEVVYEFAAGLTVPKTIKITIVGKFGVTYRFAAKDSGAINGNYTYSGFVDVLSGGSLTLQNVMIDANKAGRAIMSYGGTLTLGMGSVIENGYVTDDTSYVYGAGIYSHKGTVTLESGSQVIHNTIFSETKTAYGAGIYMASTAGHVNINGGTVSDNIICLENAEQTVNAYGAGVYVSMVNSFVMNDGVITNNQITGTMANARGAGIYAGSSASPNYNVQITGGNITGNKIACNSTTAKGSGVWATGLMNIGGDLNITNNVIGENASDLYDNSNCLTVIESFKEGASIGISSGKAASGTVFELVNGSSSYELTEDDAKVFYYNNDPESEDFFELNYDPSNHVITVGMEEPIEGGEVPVNSEDGLIEALANASNRPEDEEAGTHSTKIILQNDITVHETLNIAARRYVEISSAEGHTYSITAADDAVLDTRGTGVASVIGNLFEIAGNLKLDNVTLDANKKGRVLYALSGANVTINDGATIKGGYCAVNDTAFAESGIGLGIYTLSGARVTMNGGLITENTLHDSSVVDETGAVMGIKAGGSGLGVYNTGTFTMNGGSITGNKDLFEYRTNLQMVSSSGGAIYNTGTLTITGGTISDNSVLGSGGAIYTGSMTNPDGVGNSNSVVNISGNVIISGNKSYLSTSTNNYSGNGGAIYVKSGTVDISGAVQIKENESCNGGAICIDDGTVTLDGASVVDNIAHIGAQVNGYGAGVCISGGVFNMEAGEISGNQIINDKPDGALTMENLDKKGFGGGIFINGTGEISLQTNTGSEADYNYPTVNLTGGTITGNTALAAGSGIYVSNWRTSFSSKNDNGRETIYRFSGSSFLNISGFPKVTANTDDDIVLAAARYLKDADATVEENQNLSGVVGGVGTGNKFNVIYPQYLTITGALTDEADLHVSKELMEYDTTTTLDELANDPQTAFDNVILKGTADYDITEADMAAIQLDVSVFGEGFWQVGQTTITEGEGEEAAEISAIGVSEVQVTVDGIDAEVIYNGQAIEPEVVVTAGETNLVKGTDYDVAYEDNTDAGTAKVIITGKGKYLGTIEQTFTIVKLTGLHYTETENEDGEVIGTYTYYGEDGLVDTEYTGAAYCEETEEWLSVEGGKVVISEDGKPDTYTGLVPGENGSVYIKDGAVDASYTGFIQSGNDWYYVSKGYVSAGSTSVIRGTVNGKTASYYIGADGKVNLSYTGFVQSGSDWYYISNGSAAVGSANVIKGTVNGTQAWYYIGTDGKVNFSYTGFAQNSKGWWYVEKGKVTLTKNDIVNIPLHFFFTKLLSRLLQ